MTQTASMDRRVRIEDVDLNLDDFLREIEEKVTESTFGAI